MSSRAIRPPACSTRETDGPRSGIGQGVSRKRGIDEVERTGMSSSRSRGAELDVARRRASRGITPAWSRRDRHRPCPPARRAPARASREPPQPASRQRGRRRDRRGDRAGCWVGAMTLARTAEALAPGIPPRMIYVDASLIHHHPGVRELAAIQGCVAAVTATVPRCPCRRSAPIMGSFRIANRRQPVRDDERVRPCINCAIAFWISTRCVSTLLVAPSGSGSRDRQGTRAQSWQPAGPATNWSLPR
jgi:hypothetical protein